MGFDPNDLFTTHMFAIDYCLSFVKTSIFKEGCGDNQNPMEAILDKVNDYFDTLVNINYQHKQKGRTKITGNPNPNSPNVSLRSSSTKTTPREVVLAQRIPIWEILVMEGMKTPQKETL